VDLLPAWQRIPQPSVRRGFALLSVSMPKMKTHSGAKKRFKLTATGKVRGRHSFTSHILEKKSPKRKRHLGQPAAIAKSDERAIKRMLGAKRS
jgi:large subunit ribosomal protein L35